MKNALKRVKRGRTGEGIRSCKHERGEPSSHPADWAFCTRQLTDSLRATATPTGWLTVPTGPVPSGQPTKAADVMGWLAGCSLSLIVCSSETHPGTNCTWMDESCALHCTTPRGEGGTSPHPADPVRQLVRVGHRGRQADELHVRRAVDDLRSTGAQQSGHNARRTHTAQGLSIHSSQVENRTHKLCDSKVSGIQGF